jgi:DNA-binding NtrC family response regulator
MLPEANVPPDDDSHLIGTSRHIHHVRLTCAWLGPRRGTVVIVGESGTGKGLVARELHERGRHGRPFVRVALTQMRHSLLHSELLGHVKGAFSGATHGRQGLLEQAHGGTLFFDDLQDADEASQAILLDATEHKPMRPLGGEREFVVDARIIAGCQRPLRELAASGELRPDLAHRLGATVIQLEPLRAHPEDLTPLLAHLVPRSAAAEDLPRPAMPQPVFDALRRYRWPGNVRELEKIIESGVTEACRRSCADCPRLGGCREACPRCVMSLGDLPETVRPLARSRAHATAPDSDDLAAVLQRTAGNVQRSARELQVSRSTLHRWMQRYGIAADGFRSLEGRGIGDSVA